MINAGYLTSNADTAWPFDADAVDPALDRRAASLFADGAAILKTSEQGDKVYVEDLSVRDGFMCFTVRKGDTAERVEAEPDPGEYTVVKGDWFFFVLDNHDIAEALEDGGYDSQGPFPLDPSASATVPDKVTSFTLYNHYDGDELFPTHWGIDGEVEIRGGTNVYVGTDFDRGMTAGAGITGISGLVPNGALSNAFVIAASPGEGDGTVPCEDSNDSNDCSDGGPYAGSVNPDAEGDFVIEGDDCHQISTYGNVIRITGRCTPCCQCGAYKDTGDRLGEQARAVLAIHAQALADLGLYNAYAARFNSALSRVGDDELIVKCVALAQKIEAGAAHGVKMRSVVGSLDRGQGLLTVENASPVDVDVEVDVEMEPQRIAMASVVEPVDTSAGTTETKTKMVYAGDTVARILADLVTVDSQGNVETDYHVVGTQLAGPLDVWDYCDSNDSNDSNDSTDYEDSNDSTDCPRLVAHYESLSTITVEMVDQCVEYGITKLEILYPSKLSYSTTLKSGSAVTMRLYGASAALRPSSRCSIDGLVNFRWVEHDLESGETRNRAMVKWFSAVQEVK